MAIITDSAFSVLSRLSSDNSPVTSLAILTIDIAKAAPSNSKTIDTVVDVGKPKELKMSSRMTSVIITARNIHMTSSI